MPRFPIDINSADGQAAVKGQWRYAEGFIPGEANYGLEERVVGSPCRLPDYDDSGWEVCSDTSAWARFGGDYVTGFSFVWYRMTITIPESVGGRDPRRTRLLFETCVDDYGEVWINGECNRERGTVEGFNRTQRRRGGQPTPTRPDPVQAPLPPEANARWARRAAACLYATPTSRSSGETTIRRPGRRFGHRTHGTGCWRKWPY